MFRLKGLWRNFTAKNDEKDVMEDTFDDPVDDHFSGADRHLSVIGNIYANPELLK